MYILNIAFKLMIILIITHYFSVILKRKMNECFIFAFVFIVSILYIFSMASIKGLLIIGIYVIFLFTVYCIVHMSIIYKNNNIFKNKEIKSSIIYTIIFSTILIMINYGREVYSWDEFSHWATTVKYMFYEDSSRLYNNKKFITYWPFNLSEYPPGETLFLYYFAALNKNWTDWILYFAKDMIYIIFIMPLLGDLFNRKIIKKNAIYLGYFTGIILIDKILLNTLQVDFSLGFIAGISYILYIYFKENDIKYSLLLFYSSLLYLSIIKDIGIYFTAVLIIIVLIDLSLDYIKYKKYIVITAVYSLFNIIYLYLWKIAVYKSNIYRSVTDRDILKNIKYFLENGLMDYQETVINNYINKILFDWKFDAYLNIVCIYLIFSILSIINIYLSKDRKRKILKYATIFAFGIVYLFIILCVYLFVLYDSEAIMILVFERYFLPYNIFMYLTIIGDIFLFLENNKLIIKKDIKKYVLLVLIALYIYNIYAFILRKVYPIKEYEYSYQIKEFVEDSKKYNKVFINEEVMVIEQNTGLGIGRIIYNICPYGSVGKHFPDQWVSSNNKLDGRNFKYHLLMNHDEWNRYVYHSNYKYLYTLAFDFEFLFEYNMSFISKLEFNTLYRIFRENGKAYFIKEGLNE